MSWIIIGFGLLLFLCAFLWLIFQISDDNDTINSLFVKKGISYSGWYTIHRCPKCKEKLNYREARYYSKCCYKCGHSTGYLFDAEHVRVRDKYVDGKLVETEIAKHGVK